MLGSLAANIGTFLVLAILSKLRRDKKAEISACGVKCSGCTNAGACHGARSK